MTRPSTRRRLVRNIESDLEEYESSGEVVYLFSAELNVISAEEKGIDVDSFSDKIERYKLEEELERELDKYRETEESEHLERASSIAEKIKTLDVRETVPLDRRLSNYEDLISRMT